MVITILLRFYDRQKGGGDIFFLFGWMGQGGVKETENKSNFNGGGRLLAGSLHWVALGWSGSGSVGVCSLLSSESNRGQPSWLRLLSVYSLCLVHKIDEQQAMGVHDWLNSCFLGPFPKAFQR